MGLGGFLFPPFCLVQYVYYHLGKTMQKTYLIAIIVILAVAAIAFFTGKKEGSAPVENDSEMVFCTMDARECPDGSYVGRVGPDCQFAACPDGTNVNMGAEASIELIP